MKVGKKKMITKYLSCDIGEPGCYKGMSQFAGRCLSGVCLAALVVGSISSLVLSPEDAFAEQASSYEGGVFEEIVVNARFRDERLQDVPETVQAFSSEDVRNANINSIEDVGSLIPNFALTKSQDAGLVAINIRGIGQVRNGEPPLAIVIDGVQLSHPDQIRQPLFDISSIQVLKGPQGALYGRNAIGGAMIIQTKKPTDELQGTLEVGYGNGDYKTAQLVASGPIVKDKLYFRVSGDWHDSNGLINNVTTNSKADPENEYSVRGRLDFQPTEDLRFDLRVSHGRLKSGGAFLPFPPDADANDTSIPVQAAVNTESLRRLTDVSLKVDYDTSVGTISSVTSWSKVFLTLWEQLGHGIPDPTLGAVQDRTSKAISEDLRVTSRSDQRFRYVFGAYYLKSKPSILTDLYLLDPQFEPTVQIPIALTNNTNDAYAVYGHINYDILDNLELTLALRYDKQEVTQIDLLRNSNKTDVSYDAFQPKVSLAYKVTPDTLLYATYSEGFRSGGINAPQPLVPLIYEAEETKNIEGGIKTTLFDGKLRFNAAGFYTDDTNQAVFIYDSGLQGITTIPSSEFYGVELDATLDVSEELMLIGSFGWNNSKIKDFDGTSLYVGNNMPLTYKYSYNLSAQYELPFDNFSVISRIDYSRRQGLYWHADNVHKQSPVDLVNARIAVQFESFEIAAYMQNLFNEKYIEEFCAIAFCGGTTHLGWSSQPREYGVTARYSF